MLHNYSHLHVKYHFVLFTPHTRHIQHTYIPTGIKSIVANPLIKWMSSLSMFFFSNKEEVVPVKRKLIFEDNEVDEDTQSQSQEEDSGDSQVGSLSFYCLDLIHANNILITILYNNETHIHVFIPCIPTM